MFSDIDGHWAKGSIVALAKRQIVTGYPQGTFRPEAVVSRAEFAVLMQRSFPTLDAIRPAQTFIDVLPDYWAADAIAWCSARNLFNGDERGRFLPRQAISRLQGMVVLMAGVLAEVPGDALTDEEVQVAETAWQQQLKQAFEDAAQIPVWGQEAVAKALTVGLLEALPHPRQFQPDKGLTRGEVAALLAKVVSVPDAERIVTNLALQKSPQDIFQGNLKRQEGFDATKLAVLDSGIKQSPYANAVPKSPLRLQQPTGVFPKIPATSTYPARGQVPMVEAGGLDFLSPEMLSGCVCVGSWASGRWQARWLGRDALENRQMWSSTKFVPILHAIDRANGLARMTPIGQMLLGPDNKTAKPQPLYPFQGLADGVMSYSNRFATSNSLAAMFKHLTTPTALEDWMRKITGRSQLNFQGRYGEEPLFDRPVLWDPQSRKAIITSPGIAHRGQNLVSTYDLTRMITMAGWHWRLPQSAILPDVQGHSLSSVLRAMGVDTARYIDVALETLGLAQQVRSPVIISKSGFGRSDQRDRTELTYCALAEFDLPRPGASDPSASHQHYAVAMTLIAARRTGDGNEEARFVDALMTSEVTEIIRRLVTSEL